MCMDASQLVLLTAGDSDISRVMTAVRFGDWHKDPTVRVEKR